MFHLEPRNDDGVSVPLVKAKSFLVVSVCYHVKDRLTNPLNTQLHKTNRSDMTFWFPLFGPFLVVPYG